MNLFSLRSTEISSEVTLNAYLVSWNEGQFSLHQLESKFVRRHHQRTDPPSHPQPPPTTPEQEHNDWIPFNTGQFTCQAVFVSDSPNWLKFLQASLATVS